MTFTILILCSFAGRALCQTARHGLIGNAGIPVGLNGFGALNGFIDFDIDHPLSDVDSSVLGAQRMMGSGSQAFLGQQGLITPQSLGESYTLQQGISDQGRISSSGQLNARAHFNNRDSFSSFTSGDSAGAKSHSVTNVLNEPGDIGTQQFDSRSTRTFSRNGFIIEKSQFSPRIQTSISRFNGRLPQRSVADSRRKKFRSPNRGITSRRISFGSRAFSQIPKRR